MTYHTKRTKIGDALLLAGGADNLLLALKEGAIIASGLVEGTRGELPSVWWYHINSQIDNSHIIYFARKKTVPPTPFRAEQIDFLTADLERIFSKALSKKSAKPLAPPSQAATPARKRGRPPGSGEILGDRALVEEALKMLKDGRASSALGAATILAGNLNDKGYETKKERLRKKIAKAERSAKTPN